METFEVETLVIGAGVVGLAVARELAMHGREVLLVEQESGIGMQTSSRNSEVIHAGIYYPLGSLKAQLCVRGRQLLYDYCEKNKVPFRRCGKLIVSNSQSQEMSLERIRQHALGNGVVDLIRLDQDEVQRMEPSLRATSALYSPSTGVVDSHVLMLQLQADIEAYGGQCVFNTKLSVKKADSHAIEFTMNNESAIISARQCVNAAGLSAIDLLDGVDNFPSVCLPDAFFAKGSYFSYSGKVPFSHLIYPVPEHGGLGVHLTLDMAGAAKFGPDVEWMPSNPFVPSDYQVDAAKKHKFEQSVRQYWPGVDGMKLEPAYSGIRPKISGPNDASGDFIIQCSMQHGIKGLINLFGIESPGLTSSLAIAEKVSSLLD